MSTIIDGLTPLTGSEAARRYVDLLTGTLAMPLNFRTFADNRVTKSAGRNFTGTLEGLKADLERAQAEGHGVFVVVNGGGQSDAEISEVRAVFVDADNVSLEGVVWHRTPDFVVYRDATHWHAFWLVWDFEVHEFRALQKRLAQYYETDRSVHNELRVMRVPGFVHQKNPKKVFPVTLFDLSGGVLGDQIRSWRGHSVQSVSVGLPELADEAASSSENASSVTAFRGPPISLQRFREMLSFIDPTMAEDHGKWAGMTLAIVHDQIPLLERDGHDSIQLADDFNSGNLWRERTKDQSFEVSTYIDRDEMLKSAAGRARTSGPVITLGTIYKMAREGGYKGPPVDEMAAFDALNETTAREVHAEPSSDLFDAYFVNELDKLPDPRWLIEEVIPEDALSILYGPTGSLKTFVALDVVLSAAVLGAWASGDEGQAANQSGFKVPRPLRAAFIAGEGARGLSKRIRAWQKKHEMLDTDIPVIVIPTVPSFAHPNGVEKLIRTIQKKLGSVDLVVVDTVMRASSGFNLNIPADSQLFIDACERIRQELGTSVLLIHHTGKDRDKGLLGAENLKAAVHTVERIDLVAITPGRRTISVSQEKAKDSDLREPIYMEAKLQDVGVNSEGNGGSSLVLSRCPTPTPVKANMDRVRLSAAISIIRNHSDVEGILMRPLAEAMARSLNGGEPLEGDALANQTEVMRKWVESETRAGGKLSHLASRVGPGKKAPWRFLDPLFAAMPMAAE